MIKEQKPEGGLLQSEEWSMALKSEGKNIVSFDDGDEKMYGVQMNIPLIGKYVYLPRGKKIKSHIFKQLEGEKYSWIRVDVEGEDDLSVIRDYGKVVVKAPHNIQSRQNFIIDITKPSDELLAQMKSKTRYNIRLSEKKDVSIVCSKEQKYIDHFFDLVGATEKRKNVSFHSKEHYEKIIESLSDEQVELFSAEYGGEIIASNLVTFHRGVATYLHGATSDSHRNIMAPFLLQWKIIEEAKRRGCDWYDFGGVFPDASDSGKKGITRFKLGFAPKEKIYTTKGSYDIVLIPWKYKLYRFLQKIR